MIIHLKSSVTDAEVEKVAEDLDAFIIKKPEHPILVTPSALQEVPTQIGRAHV